MLKESFRNGSEKYFTRGSPALSASAATIALLGLPLSAEISKVENLCYT